MCHPDKVVSTIVHVNEYKWEIANVTQTQSLTFTVILIQQSSYALCSVQQ